MKIIQGNICAPQGFLSCGIHVGLKKNQQKKDLALIYSTHSAVAAGVFTTNLIQAAPVLVTKNHLQSGSLQAIVINSGNANACTGAAGLEHALAIADATAHALKLNSQQVAVASTGVIGVPLAIEKVLPGIAVAAPLLNNDPNDESAAAAIITTDTFIKHIAVECTIANKIVRIGGIAKGSGMIHPMMATMLAFITSDVAINSSLLQKALTEANEDSFHMISVDGDTSTNDMALMLANGLADNPEISSENSEDYQTFVKALRFVCIHLAKKIAEDGEGASKLIEVNITGANSKANARIAARAICKSSLVKTAVFGEDANWGRIAAALGASGILFNPEKLGIKLGNLSLFHDGMPVAFDEDLTLQYLKQKQIVINVNLADGSEYATAWGCDLTFDYVKINASYRS